MEARRAVVPAAEEIIDLYFPVLDYGFVALKDYMGSDKAIEDAARSSYGLGTRHTSEREHLIRFLYRHEHGTPFEMPEVKLHIGLPIMVMRQLVRQRTASMNEYSGRYSVMPMLFYTPAPENVCKQSKQNKQGRAGYLDGADLEQYYYEMEQSRLWTKRQYHNALDMDVAREIARNELPLSTYTFAYWKIDIRNMFNLLCSRLPGNAQYEYRCYARVFAGIVQRLCPFAFSAFEDYRLNAVRFSQAELAALPAYFASLANEREPSHRVRQYINEILHANGVKFTKSGKESREQSEFWEKLQPKPKQDFTLDLSTARDAGFYERLVKEHQ